MCDLDYWLKWFRFGPLFLNWSLTTSCYVSTGFFQIFSYFSGKSSLACALSRALHNRGKLSYILDGDNVRHGLNSDLSFEADDRAENIRRVGEVAKLFADSGIICIASLISPYRIERAACRALLPQGDFIEVSPNSWIWIPVSTSIWLSLGSLDRYLWMCHSMFVKLEIQRAYTNVHALVKSKVTLLFLCICFQLNPCSTDFH